MANNYKCFTTPHNQLKHLRNARETWKLPDSAISVKK